MNNIFSSSAHDIPFSRRLHRFLPWVLELFLSVLLRGEVPDPTQFDKKSQYYDPKSDPSNPRWHTVRVAYRQKFTRFIALSELRTNFPNLIVAQRGSRLSVTPIEASVAQKLLDPSIE